MKSYHFRTLVLSLLAPAVTYAQVAPDAGQSIRELERPQLQAPAPDKLELNLPFLDDSAPVAGGPSLHVNRFRITGHSVFPDAELRALLADLEDRELSFAELQAAAQRLSSYYREHGYMLARAYLPAQEVEDGVIEIAVLEGGYGEIQVDDQVGLRGFAMASIDSLQSGEAVRAKPLERSLLLLADTPGVEIDAMLRPGASVGASDLIVNVMPGQGFSGTLHLDNHGSRYTGAARLGGAYSLNNPLRLGDTLDLRLMTSEEDQLYVRAGYQLPVGPWSTRLGVAYSYMDYELGEDFADLDATGRARIASAFVLQPLLRSRALSLYASLQYDHKRLEDKVGLFDSRSDKNSSVWIASLTGDSRDSFGGGGVNSFSLAYAAGKLELESPLERLQDSFTSRSHGRFDRMNVSLLRLQNLPGRFSLSTRLQGQWSNDNLDSSEKFSLGGAHAVRAYPQGEASGDRGMLVNVDLNYAVADGWQAALFADYGRIRLNAKPWTLERNHRELSGAGLALRGMAYGWRLETSAAWRLDDAPRSEADRKPRVWLQLMRQF